MPFDTNIYGKLDMNTPIQLSQLLDPANIEKRRAGRMATDEQVMQMQEQRTIRDLLRNSPDIATAAQKLGSAGMYEQAGKLQNVINQNATAQRGQQDWAAKQRDSANQKTLEQATFAAYANPSDEAMSAVFAAHGMPQPMHAQFLEAVKDPEQRRIIASLPPSEWGKSIMKKGEDGKSGGKIGNYNPGDYTPSSFEKFTKSGSPSDLVRYQSPARDTPPQVVMIAGVPSLVDRRTQTVTPLATPEAIAATSAITKTGKTSSGGDAGKSAIRNPTEASALLRQITPLIDVATSSGFGAARDTAAGMFGASTKGADAAASLRSLGAALVMQMPRMEGPQSDRDVALYKDMAGRIGDSEIPASQKMAAIKTIDEILGRYGMSSIFSNGKLIPATMQPKEPAAPAQGAKGSTPTWGHSDSEYAAWKKSKGLP